MDNICHNRINIGFADVDRTLDQLHYYLIYSVIGYWNELYYNIGHPPNSYPTLQSPCSKNWIIIGSIDTYIYIYIYIHVSMYLFIYICDIYHTKIWLWGNWVISNEIKVCCTSRDAAAIRFICGRLNEFTSDATGVFIYFWSIRFTFISGRNCWQLPAQFLGLHIRLTGRFSPGCLLVCLFIFLDYFCCDANLLAPLSPEYSKWRTSKKNADTFFFVVMSSRRNTQWHLHVILSFPYHLVCWFVFIDSCHIEVTSRPRINEIPLPYRHSPDPPPTARYTLWNFLTVRVSSFLSFLPFLLASFLFSFGLFAYLMDHPKLFRIIISRVIPLPGRTLGGEGEGGANAAVFIKPSYQL